MSLDNLILPLCNTKFNPVFKLSLLAQTLNNFMQIKVKVLGHRIKLKGVANDDITFLSC